MAAAKGDNLPPIIVKKVTVVEGGHHGGAWKVAYADFVTAMMAFFLLMWLLGATTEDQRRGLADYFTPTLVKIKDSGAGANGLLSGASLTDVDDYPNRQGQTGNKGLTVPRDAMGGPKEAARMIERITSRTKDRLERDPKLAKLMSQIKMVDTTEGVRIDLVDDADFSMFNLGTTVLTRDAAYDAPGCELCRTLDEALARVADVDEAMIIGGAALYRDALSRADRVYLTEVDAAVGGDVHFPALDERDWIEVSREPHRRDERHAWDYCFRVLERLTRD